MSKRFVGLTKEERISFGDLILALVFKYSEEGDKYFDSSLNDDSKSLPHIQDEIFQDEVWKNKKTKDESEYFESLNKSPKQIKKMLDEYMIGQSEAKKILSVAFFNHVRRIKAMEIAEHENKECNIKKSNALILGPTGTGKTYLVETLSKVYDLPVYCADASTITQAGFVGKNAHEVIEQLWLKSGKDIKKTERGIVFLDEIDKLATTKEGKQNSMAEGAQQSLLKMIEGSEVEIEIGPDKSKKLTINTKNILFVLAGAFVGLVGENTNKESKEIGFVTSETIKNDPKMKKIMPNDLVKYGIIPELIGRISMIAQMHLLDKEDLEKILKNTKNNIVDQYKELYTHDNIELKVDKKVYPQIAEKALALKIGARSLKSIVDYLMVDKIYDIELEGDQKTSEIILNEKYVKNQLNSYNKIEND